MKNDEKEMNLRKKKGLELSDQGLDAVAGGQTLGYIICKLDGQSLTYANSLDDLKNWLDKQPTKDGPRFKVNIESYNFSDEDYQVREKILSMPGVDSVLFCGIGL